MLFRPDVRFPHENHCVSVPGPPLISPVNPQAPPAPPERRCRPGGSTCGRGGRQGGTSGVVAELNRCFASFVWKKSEQISYSFGHHSNGVLEMFGDTKR